MKIAHFSDTHLGHYYEPEDLQVAVDKVNENKPDFICFTGDLFDRDLVKVRESIAVLSGLKAPYGKFAVLGNHDYRTGADEVRRIISEAGFQLLDNQHQTLLIGGQPLCIAGIDNVSHGRPDIEAAIRDIPQESCVILLAHEPDIADTAAGYPIDLQLSGHSHGGQVRLPFIGHLLTPEYGHKYPDGLQQVPHSSLQVYTSRGLGTTILPIRFFCRPEITIIELASQQ